MKLILTEKEIERLVYNAFVDGGLSELGFADIEIKFFDTDYEKAKNVLKADKSRKDTICYEDVLMQIFRDKKLVFIDHNDGNRIEFTPELASTNLKKVLASEKQNKQAVKEIIDSLDEEGDADAYTHFNILQYMLFNEIVYG